MMAPSLALRDTVIGAVLIVQEFTLLSIQALRGLTACRRYLPEIIVQVERVGVGSLFIVILTGLFTGMVLTLQGAIQLNRMAPQFMSLALSAHRSSVSSAPSWPP